MLNLNSKHTCYMTYIKNNKTPNLERRFFKTEKKAFDYISNNTNLTLSSIEPIDTYEASLIIEDDILWGAKCATQIGKDISQKLQKNIAYLKRIYITSWLTIINTQKNIKNWINN